MSNEIEWGAEIEVNGVRLPWLQDDDKLQWLDKRGWGPWGLPDWDAWGPSDTHTTAGRLDWDGIAKIRIPADHWAYIAINAGFEPFAGGDGPPEDWDGGKVLIYDVTASNGRTQVRKNNGIITGCWQRNNSFVDIIGYHKKKDADVSELPDDWAIELAVKDFGWSWTSDSLKNAFDANHPIVKYARMIQQFKPELKPIDKDVLAVREILGAYCEARGYKDILLLHLNGSRDEHSPFQAALAAYKKHK